MKYYPINLDVTDKKALVVGGGQIAYRKVKDLASCGASVTVVSPRFCAALLRMKGIQRLKREYKKTDIRGACVVVSATDSQKVNRRVSEHADSVGIPVNVVDQPALCSFIVPALLSRGELLIAISTGGASPAMARRLREKLEADLDPAFVKHLSLMKEIRPDVLSSGLNPTKRKKLFMKMADQSVSRTLRQKGISAARVRMRSMLREATDRKK